jgi:ABC-type multidrug transport system fused ATPase/permease subunit
MAPGLRSDFQILRRHTSPARRRQLVLLALLMPATALAEMALVVAIVPFLAQLTGRGNPASHYPPLSKLLDLFGGWFPANPMLAAAALFACAVLATATLRLALSWLSQQFSFGLGLDLDVAIQRRLLHQPYLFHLHRHSSELLTTLDKVDFLIFSAALQGLQAASAALIGLLVVIALLWIDPLVAALAAILVGGLYGLAMLMARRRLDAHASIIRQSFEARLKVAQDNLGGIRDIILDQSQELRVNQFKAIDARFMRARADAAFLVSAPRYLVEAIGLVMIALLAVAIADRPGGLVAALPVLGALALGAQRLLPVTSQIYSGWANLAASRPIVRALADLLDLPIDKDDQRAIAPLPLASEIELHDVTFHYADPARPVLQGVSLKIPKGARLAITGKTGSGKSTLSDLLMGLIEPGQGQMTVDGVEVTGPRRAGWRRSVAHVPQSIFLTDDSIAANIAMALPGAVVDVDRVRKAAETAQLTGFIETLPQGFDTKIGERGARLSGGQRQRLALARAIYKDTALKSRQSGSN